MLEAEQDIIVRARGGDAAAFGQLYDHYIKPIYRFIAIKVSPREEAEDLTHEVFLTAWQKLPSFEPRGFPFSSWLYKIARNRVIDFYRTKKTTFAIEEIDEEMLKVVEFSTERVDVSLTLEKVKEAMEELSPDQQDVLILRFVEDMTPKEIALVMGKKEGAVRIIQHRALLQLKKYLTNIQA